jgi:alpha-methylacyl-CoA racemase
MTAGPLSGLKFVEMAGIGPAPFAAMMLADLGATGVRIESPVQRLTFPGPEFDITRRGRSSMHLNLREPVDLATARDLIDAADLLIEGYRPGVMERLGLGPQATLGRNPKLVFGRITGWGQDGPYALRAGHDLDFIAVAGILAHVGRRGQPPTPPQNLVADYGGGAMLLLVGVLAALWESQRSGLGQVVDAAMVDGSALLTSMMRTLTSQGLWSPEVGVNILDSGAPFYDVYATADSKWLAVACLEADFFAEFVSICALDNKWLEIQYDPAHWAELRAAIAELIATRTQEAWSEAFAATDACVAPVLTMDEAPLHPQLAYRRTFLTVNGQVQPAPAPRFSRTPTALNTD